MSDEGATPQYPAYPGSGAPEGSMPPPPAPRPPVPAPERPGSVRLAVVLMWAAAVLTLVTVVVNLAFLGAKDDFAEGIRDADPNATQGEIDFAYAIGLGVGAFFGVVAIGLWIWMAWKNGQGRAWARVVASVLGGVNLLFLGFGLIATSFLFATGGVDVYSTVVGIVEIVLVVVILTLLWQSSSRTYYDAVSERQMS